MSSSLLLTIRTLVVLSLLLAMPLLAIPQVNQMVGSLWCEVAPQWLTVRGRDEPTSESPAAIQPGTGEMSLRKVNSIADPPSVTNFPSAATSRFKSVSARLKQLGAKNIRLETVGADHDQFRFHCQLPVGDSVYARTFERTAADPDVAMERVLADVRTWQVSRRELDRHREGYR